jgi:hypothetical protein
MKEKKPFRSLCTLALVLFTALGAAAQELRCNVTVNSNQIQETGQIADKQVFRDLQQAIADFMNTRRWTEDKFSANERINCNLVFTITKVPTINSFEAQLQVQSSRPVYGTDYESIVLNYVDRRCAFQFTPGQPMDFNENIVTSALTTLLGFYANLIVGLDYDSFGRLGGNTYLQRAYNIAQTAGQPDANAGPGWQSSEDTRNRYWLAENLINQQLQPVREGLYIYHRQGMDSLLENPEEARGQILGVLNTLREVNQQKPQAVLTNAFFDSKSNELVNVFSQAAPQEKMQAYNLLVELDPTQTERYKKLTR